MPTGVVESRYHSRRVELSNTLYLDKNRYAIRGDASFSTYTATPHIPALMASVDGADGVTHVNGGDVENEQLCVIQK